MTNGNDSMTNDPMTIPSSLGPYHLFTDVCVGLLNQGQSVRFKANGWSMHPTICDGEMINVEPVLPSQVRHGDIILYRSLRGITAHRVVHIQKEMEPHGQASYPIQPPMWGDIPVRSWRIPSSAGAESVLSPQSSLLRFYTRGDSLEATDPPLTADQILGKVFSVERNGQTVALYGTRAIIIQKMRLFLFRLKRYVIYALSGVKGLLSRYKVPSKINGTENGQRRNQDENFYFLSPSTVGETDPCPESRGNSQPVPLSARSRIVL